MGSPKKLIVKTKVLKLFLCLSLFPLFVSAQDGYFTPAPLIFATHTNGQQLNISLGYGKGVDINASLAFTNNFFVFFTGNSNKGTYKRRFLLGGSYFNYRDNSAYSGGIGYFSNVTEKIIFEIAAGLGKCKTLNEEDIYSFKQNTTISNYSNLFTQVSVTKIKTKSEIGLGLRCAYSPYTKFEQYKGEGFYPTLDGIYTINIEPAINYHYRIKQFKIGLQIGTSIQISKPITTSSYSNIPVEFDASMLRFNVQYNINLKPIKKLKI